MNAHVFVDTNVLLYAIDTTDPNKQQLANKWRAALWQSRRGRVSFQVLQEFYVKATHNRAAVREQARAEVRNLFSWEPIFPTPTLLEHAWKVQDRYRLSFWDSLIVAAAKAASCTYLLTEDLQANQVLDGILVVNPFLSSPESILG